MSFKIDRAVIINKILDQFILVQLLRGDDVSKTKTVVDCTSIYCGDDTTYKFLNNYLIVPENLEKYSSSPQSLPDFNFQFNEIIDRIVKQLKDFNVKGTINAVVVSPNNKMTRTSQDGLTLNFSTIPKLELLTGYI